MSDKPEPFGDTLEFDTSVNDLEIFFFLTIKNQIKQNQQQ